MLILPILTRRGAGATVPLRAPNGSRGPESPLMVRRVSQSLVAWFLLWDLALIAGAWLLAYSVRFHSGLFSNHRGVPALALYLRALPLVLLVGMVAFRFAGMYEVHRLRRFREELGAVAQGVGLMALLVMATSFARQAQHESRGAMVMFAVGTLVGVVAVRRASWTGDAPAPRPRRQPEPRADRRHRPARAADRPHAPHRELVRHSAGRVRRGRGAPGPRRRPAGSRLHRRTSRSWSKRTTSSTSSSPCR